MLLVGGWVSGSARDGLRYVGGRLSRPPRHPSHPAASRDLYPPTPAARIGLPNQIIPGLFLLNVKLSSILNDYLNEAYHIWFRENYDKLK